MTKTRLEELRRWRDEYKDAAGVSMQVFSELLDAVEKSRTVYVSQYAMNTDPIDGIYSSREAAEAADEDGDNRIEKWLVQDE